MTPGRDGRINGEILSARFIHLEVSRYSPNEELDISWSTLDENSVKNTVGLLNDSKISKRLRCGTRTFLCILLLNPKGDLLPSDDMVDHTPTLTWLEGVLDEIGLGLDHVIIMDLLPMLTDNWLGEYPAERDKVIPEMLKLTLDLFESSSYILSSLVNAFTISGMSAEVLYHGMLRKLCSNMDRAERQIVSGFCFENHSIHSVAAFHPAKVFAGARRQKTGTGRAFVLNVAFFV
ncbi:Pc13g12710 [Penicillium rubens Wisconsin 54-1255]|uniref:Pc13g12710 protein n=1 Tax=Penicillium rubens (strain ATCC 28089 / DSM 1075 / NRRL 1951 / Wisconsin 54-1255) TaxID=500485 RepID=B6H336_PENRW|nr:Pc13g12710 [Penicillium rubens Wisconsin 54-1255]